MNWKILHWNLNLWPTQSRKFISNDLSERKDLSKVLPWHLFLIIKENLKKEKYKRKFIFL